jgi:chromosome segregation ATPase
VDETERQLAELREELSARREARQATRRRQDALDIQAAHFGREAPPHITTEIADLVEKRRSLDATIREIERQIARLELAPQSGLIIPAGQALPELVPAVIDTRIRALEWASDRIESALAQIGERLDAKDASDREWRHAERDARRDGQKGYRLLLVGLAAALFVVAVAVVALLIRVY